MRQNDCIVVTGVTVSGACGTLAAPEIPRTGLTIFAHKASHVRLSF